jgi:uncharacterized DUF497 family protein
VDVNFHLDGLDFIWDANKAASNLSKHGIDFQLACQVFLDRYAMYGDASVVGESRQSVTGEVEDSRLLFVVHLERDDAAIRIISARQATGREKRLYENTEGTA